MTETLQTQNLNAHLLANRGMLNLTKASLYLISRLRIRTPLGAAEFLGTTACHGRKAYDDGLKLTIEICGMYQEMFSEAYQRSWTPAFSLQREQEFFQLVERYLFPLGLEKFKDEPDYYLPYIPVKGRQSHNWLEGCCPFEKLETVYKVALVLSGMMREKWRTLPINKEPAPPLGKIGRTFFVYSCAVEETPIRALRIAFHLITHKTGNVWLDAPISSVHFGYEWSREDVARLWKERLEADEAMHEVMKLSHWLDEDPTARIGRIVELWNRAAKMEEQR